MADEVNGSAGVSPVPEQEFCAPAIGSKAAGETPALPSTALQDVDVKDLPPLAQELVALIGFAATILLVEFRPGIPLYVPDVMFPEHPLAGALGMIAATALVKNYGGETITVPNCKLALIKIRQRHIVKSREDGYSQTEAALLHGVTPRWVREVESREPEVERNGRLF